MSWDGRSLGGRGVAASDGFDCTGLRSSGILFNSVSAEEGSGLDARIIMIAYLSQVLPRPWSSTFHSPVPSQPTYVSCDLGSRQRIRHRNEHHGMLMPQLRLGQTICYSCSQQGDKRATRANQSHCLQEDTDLPVVGAQARNGRQSDHNRQTRRRGFSVGRNCHRTEVSRDGSQQEDGNPKTGVPE